MASNIIVIKIKNFLVNNKVAIILSILFVLLLSALSVFTFIFSKSNNIGTSQQMKIENYNKTISTTRTYPDITQNTTQNILKNTLENNKKLYEAYK